MGSQRLTQSLNAVPSVPLCSLGTQCSDWAICLHRRARVFEESYALSRCHIGWPLGGLEALCTLFLPLPLALSQRVSVLSCPGSLQGLCSYHASTQGCLQPAFQEPADVGGEAGLAGSAGLSSRLSLAWGTLSLYFIPGKDRPPCSLMLTCTSAHLVPRCPCSKGEADAPFIPFLLLRLPPSCPFYFIGF